MCENFDNVKVGDKVFFSMGAWHKTEYLAEVTKVTNTQFEAKGTKFRKADGRAMDILRAHEVGMDANIVINV